jgi:hypothetical protein
MVERLTSAVQGVFPLVVALVVRPRGIQATRDNVAGPGQN